MYHVTNIYRTRTLCYGFHLHYFNKEAKKWPKMATAAHSLRNNSKTKIVSRFCQAYSSEGVSNLCMTATIVATNLSVCCRSPT